MTETDTQVATRVLEHLLKGAEVSGLRFGTPQLLFDGVNRLPGEAYINLESHWLHFEQRPDQFPLQESEPPEMPRDEELEALLRLRGRTIVNVEIMSPPHLVLTFDDDSVLYINGHDDMYESWQAGQSRSDDDIWLVVACPGGGLAVWAPDGF